MQDEMCVCKIEKCLKMTQSNVSRHLTALKSSGILDSNKMKGCIMIFLLIGLR